MEYNTLKKQLIIPEYGRHLQDMVDYCKTISDKKDRNDFAEVIIDVMGSFSPHLRDVDDFKHKLWDHLFLMAEYDIDVDSPYPITPKQEIERKPEKLPYPKHIKKHRYYGSVIQEMIQEACTWEPGEKRDGLVLAIANQMKKAYLTWNKDQVDNSTINQHLIEISNNTLSLQESDILIENINKARGYTKKRKPKRKSR